MSNNSGEEASLSSGELEVQHENEQQQQQNLLHTSSSAATPSSAANSDASTNQQQQPTKKKRNLPGTPGIYIPLLLNFFFILQLFLHMFLIILLYICILLGLIGATISNLSYEIIYPDKSP